MLTLLSPPGAHSPALGLLLFYLAGAVLVSAGVGVAALSKGLAALTLALAAARFALTGVYEYLSGTGWKHVAGWVGLALCVVALLAAAAFANEDARRSLLPVVEVVATLGVDRLVGEPRAGRPGRHLFRCPRHHGHPALAPGPPTRGQAPGLTPTARISSLSGG